MRSFPFPILLLVFVGLALPACDTNSDADDDEMLDGPFAEARQNPGVWSWVGVEGAACRDGSATGFGVRLQEDSDDFVIYLEGGGACFNDPTCSRNDSSFSETKFDTGIAGGRGMQGLFDMSNADNPVADWNVVYVPYCTGDVHGGSRTDVQVSGVNGLQQFVGHDNMALYLDLLSDEFDDVDHVLLTGISAGGFGTLINYPQVEASFPASEVTLLNDSGPPLADDDVLSPSLQAQWVALWGLDETLPDDADAILAEDGFTNAYGYYTSTYPDETFGLLSHLRDGVIRQFYSFGQIGRDPDCLEALENGLPCVEGSEYEDALYDVRDNVAPAWGTYYTEGTGHTYLVSDFYSTSVNGVPLTTWVSDLLDDNPRDVAPATSAAAAE